MDQNLPDINRQRPASPGILTKIHNEAVSRVNGRPLRSQPALSVFHAIEMLLTFLENAPGDSVIRLPVRTGPRIVCAEAPIPSLVSRPEVDRARLTIPGVIACKPGTGPNLE